MICVFNFRMNVENTFLMSRCLFTHFFSFMLKFRKPFPSDHPYRIPSFKSDLQLVYLKKLFRIFDFLFMQKKVTYTVKMNAERNGFFLGINFKFVVMVFLRKVSIPYATLLFHVQRMLFTGYATRGLRELLQLYVNCSLRIIYFSNDKKKLFSSENYCSFLFKYFLRIYLQI